MSEDTNDMRAEDHTDLSTFLSLDEVEKRYILMVLASCSGVRKTASRILGIDRKTLYRKLVRWGVDGTTSAPDAIEIQI